MKKSFILHVDSLEVLDVMSDEQAGKLLKRIRAYHKQDPTPSDDQLVEAVFIQFKNQFDRDLEKRKEKTEERQKSGTMGNLKRRHPDLYKKVESGKLSLEQAQDILENRKTSLSDNSESLKSQTVANVAVNVNDNVNVSDSVNDNKNNLSKKKEQQVVKNTGEKKLQKQEYEKSETTKKIDWLIREFKERCKLYGIVYNTEKERMFGSHVFSKKFGGIAVEYGFKDGPEFLFNILDASMQEGNWWNFKINSIKKAYQKYPDVYSGLREAQQKQKKEQKKRRSY